MPELGEVEIVRQNLIRWWVNKSAKDVTLVDTAALTQGEPEEFIRVLSSPCVGVRRRGKYLILEFSDDHAVIFHFRMTGKIAPCTGVDDRFVRVAWTLEDRWYGFMDARRLGHVELFLAGELQNYGPLIRMGPEPEDIDGATLQKNVGKRGLKNALLDQRVIAGVGNIAVSEVFYRQGLPPTAKGSDLVGSLAWDNLAKAIAEFFDEVIEEQSSDEVIYLNQGALENPFDVYKREGLPCVRCGQLIRRDKVAGRSSYFCPSCQS